MKEEELRVKCRQDAPNKRCEDCQATKFECYENLKQINLEVQADEYRKRNVYQK